MGPGCHPGLVDSKTCVPSTLSLGKGSPRGGRGAEVLREESWGIEVDQEGKRVLVP